MTDTGTGKRPDGRAGAEKLSRREIKRRFGIGPWKQLGFEAAARDALGELYARDQNVMVATFDTEPRLVMVFARGERADQLQAIVNGWTDTRPGGADQSSNPGVGG